MILRSRKIFIMLNVEQYQIAWGRSTSNTPIGNTHAHSRAIGTERDGEWSDQKGDKREYCHERFPNDSTKSKIVKNSRKIRNFEDINALEDVSEKQYVVLKTNAATLPKVNCLLSDSLTHPVPPAAYTYVQ